MRGQRLLGVLGEEAILGENAGKTRFSGDRDQLTVAQPLPLSELYGLNLDSQFLQAGKERYGEALVKKPHGEALPQGWPHTSSLREGFRKELHTPPKFPETSCRPQGTPRYALQKFESLGLPVVLQAN